MSTITYEASVYSRTVNYKNFAGEEKSVTLYFALDPLQLMSLVASFEIKKVKSGNPALNGKPQEITGEQQFKFIRKLANEAAGTPSEDGESWAPFENFEDSLAGKAFMTKLASSDGDRREFAEKVILEPLKAFVGFAEVDPTNTPKDVQDFKVMMTQMENIFKMPDPAAETIDDRRARLAAEMASLEQQAPSPAAQQYIAQQAAPTHAEVPTNAQIPIING